MRSDRDVRNGARRQRAASQPAALPSRQWRRFGSARAARLLGALAVILAFRPLGAQAAPSDGAARVHASRSELEALAADAERVAASIDASAQIRESKRAEAQSLRARLRDGDFRPGDRIVLRVHGDSALTDTFTVRTERTLDLPGLPPIPLEGVLRSELQDHLASRISRFVKVADVEARPLLRIAVIGEVTRPGYYMLTPDRLVTDAIMLAGGPTQEADLTRTTIRRDTSVLWDQEELRTAIGGGRTLSQLDLGPGDEIIVAEEKRRNWDTVLRTVSVISGIVLSIYGATRIF